MHLAAWTQARKGATGKLPVAHGVPACWLRPEIIRLSRTIALLDKHCEHLLVHTGQNYDYELNEVFFSDLGIRKPDHFLEAAGETAAQTIGKVIMAADLV